MPVATVLRCSTVARMKSRECAAQCATAAASTGEYAPSRSYSRAQTSAKHRIYEGARVTEIDELGESLSPPHDRERGAAASDAVGQVLHQAEQPRALHRRRHQRVPRARASAVHQVGESTADQRDPPPTIVCGGQPHAKPARADVAGNFTQPLNLPEIVPPRVQRTCEVAATGPVSDATDTGDEIGVVW